MMVLLLAASLVEISGIYQYVEGQGPPPVAKQKQPQQQGQKVKDVVPPAVLSFPYLSE